MSTQVSSVKDRLAMSADLLTAALTFSMPLSVAAFMVVYPPTKSLLSQESPPQARRSTVSGLPRISLPKTPREVLSTLNQSQQSPRK